MDFIVGDEWRVAAGLAFAVALTALLAHDDVPAWWLMPVAVCTRARRLAAMRHAPP